jgi:outer membrane protein TolC
VPTLPLPQLSLEEVVAQAYSQRPDYLAAEQRFKAAEAEVTAARSGFFPSVALTGDYGVTGLSVAQSLPTFSVMGQVNVPLFEGGRTHGRRRRLVPTSAAGRARGPARAVCYNARVAFLDLQSAEEQLDGARARELADLQLTAGPDRFAAGVASNLRSQAQEAVAAATEGYIAGL